MNLYNDIFYFLVGGRTIFIDFLLNAVNNGWQVAHRVGLSSSKHGFQSIERHAKVLTAQAQ